MSDLDDLGLSLTSQVRSGRAAKPLSAEFVRELSEADLMIPASQVQTAPLLKKIRDSHHALARVLATGNSEAEASAVTGYTASRISILKADPQFKELLEFYRMQADGAVADLRARMANMGLDAIQELQERMNDSPEDFSLAMLKDIVREMADRTGHAPQRGPTNVTQINVGLSDKMAAARERVAAARNPVTIPIEIEHE